MTDSKLSYIDTGKGKETLLFIHGFCGSHEYWSDIIAGLKEEYRVIAVDLRGHGASEEIGSLSRLKIWLLILRHFGRTGNRTGIYVWSFAWGYITLAFAEKVS